MSLRLRFFLGVYSNDMGHLLRAVGLHVGK